MLWVLPALMALGSGIGNALMGSSQRNELNSRIDTLIKQLKENEIDSDKMRTYTGGINSIFNNNVTNTLNKTAFSQRGAINSNVSKAAMVAPIEGNRLQALTELRTRADATNLNIQEKIGQLEMSKATGNVVSDFLGGSVQGGMAGMQMETLIDENSRQDELTSKALGTTNNETTSAVPSTENNLGQAQLP
jgi:hypothetical protein